MSDFFHKELSKHSGYKIRALYHGSKIIGSVVEFYTLSHHVALVMDKQETEEFINVLSNKIGKI